MRDLERTSLNILTKEAGFVKSMAEKGNVKLFDFANAMINVVNEDEEILKKVLLKTKEIDKQRKSQKRERTVINKALRSKGKELLEKIAEIDPAELENLLSKLK